MSYKAIKIENTLVDGGYAYKLQGTKTVKDIDGNDVTILIDIGGQYRINNLQKIEDDIQAKIDAINEVE